MPKEPITLHDDGTVSRFDEDSDRFPATDWKWRLFGFVCILISMVLSLWGVLSIAEYIMEKL